MSKRAAIYLRVSSASQVNTDIDPEGLSLPSQRKRCRDHASRIDAQVVREYVEPGISGGSVLKRAAFQEMLADIEKKRDIDMVIVWNVSRWARDEEDLWVAYGLLRRYGVELVSVTEPIDNSPTGLLMLGVLGAVAAHDRRKLSLEVSRGRLQKVEVGGTPNRAPLGYLNVRKTIEGHEVRTVELDPERAPLIRLAFEMYATGNYSLSELADFLEDRGLRSRATKRYDSRPLTAQRLQAILRNDYYTGVVRNAGKSYAGRHEPLVSLSTFQAVQEVLDGKRVAGERDRVHSHYLKGSLYCAECDGRLMFSRNSGNGGSYDYFLCRGRQLGTCSQPYRSVEAIERAVVRHYGTVQLSAEKRQEIRDGIRERFSIFETLHVRERERARLALERLKTEERKLLRAHYKDSISEDLFREEEVRIRRERVAAEQTLSVLNGEYQLALANLDRALELTDNLQAAYDLAPPHVRRLLNQGLFAKLLVLAEDIDEHVARPPFDWLLDERGWSQSFETARVATSAEADQGDEEDGNERTADLVLVGGSINERLVELVGLEPTTSWVRFDRSARE